MKSNTILLVDDNPANLKLLVDCLEGQNIKVAVAQDGQGALQRLGRAHLPKPDLILLDVMMPGIDGFETCRRIKAVPELSDIPVIFMSALTDTSDKVSGFSMGGVDYITKPIQIEEMLARVKTHLELAELRKSLDLGIRMRTQELVDVNNSLRHEIEERKRIEAQVRYIATHDSLTDLPNRVLLEDRLNLLIAQAGRRNEKVILMFLDLDQFKIVNDSLGHHVGDELLREVALRLKDCLRNEDTVARFGGDEFILCLPIHDCDEEINLIARKVFDSLREPFSVDEYNLHVGSSIGVAIFPDDGIDADTLMRNADTAMYHAKRSGRAEIKLYTSDLNENAHARLNLSNLLREAIRDRELYMEYQPQIDLVSGEIIGAEALMRWCRQDGALISPAEFIPVAESNGLIKELGEWGLRQSCKELKRWHDAGYGHLRMSVNISVPQLHSAGFVEATHGVINEFQLPPNQLELEITESLLMQHSEANLSILRDLSEIGIRLSIDDFGTGYSSLAYLQDFPVNVLKIDLSFVRNMGTEHGNAIPSAIIAMAHSLHLKVVAEGIESAAQESMLKSLGCDFAQGFYYSRSVPGKDLLEMCGNGMPRITREK
ncbi:GGDEF domain-containing response regulator [Sedimenticola hydrogenitrophicus]|uniref:two-component system response regulator n=1 Tax=Sedimenticola hydrogenitrophicus TaxID=2967975 RepID=UPI0023B1985E|nr:GGDEF domain-containing response regulator [Sedimenticola hydrogenitrophicus]